MEFSAEQKRKKFLLEVKDIFAGAAFPFMMQVILSVSVILFADFSEDTALRVFALVFGEVLFAVAYFIFGKMNGITAVRKLVQGSKKRELSQGDPAWFKTGEYALWKGAVIGLISVIPFMIVEFIQCLAPNTGCEFILKYAFGWAAYPFILIGQATGKLSEWLNFIWIIFPVGVHLGGYAFGAGRESVRQQKVAEAQKIKEKHRK